MIKRYFNYESVMGEVSRILGGAASAVLFEGKKELYSRNGRMVEVEREFMFDDDFGNNVYNLKLES